MLTFYYLIQIIRELKEEVSKLKELLVKEGYNPDDLQCKFFTADTIFKIFNPLLYLTAPLPIYLIFYYDFAFYPHS